MVWWEEGGYCMDQIKGLQEGDREVKVKDIGGKPGCIERLID